MKRTKAKRTKTLSLLLGLCMVLGLLFAPVQNVLAAEANESILEARKGVLQVAAVVKVDGEEAAYTHVGTGFLVGGQDGGQTVITNHHVAHALTEQAARESLGIPAESKVEIGLCVIVKRDVRINASTVNESAQADFSILKLEQPIYDRAPLTLADSDNVATTQEVYALGFPGIVQDLQTDGVYTSDDVTVTQGIVSKTSDVTLVDSPIACITHSAQVTYGNSGGPLVDQNGYVIGINTIMSNEEGNHDYFFSTKINEVREVLDALGIEYIFADDPVPQPESESVETPAESSAGENTETTAPVETEAPESGLREDLGAAIQMADGLALDNMTQDSVDNFNAALDAAKAVYNNDAATDEEISQAIADLNTAQDGLLEKSGMNTTLIIIIAVAAIVVIVVVVIIIVAVSSSSKKKKAQEAMRQKERIAQGMAPGRGSGMGPGPVPGMGSGGPAPGGPAPGGWNPSGQNFQQPFGGGPAPSSAASDGSAETGVLNAGASESTVLGGGQGVPPAALVRSKNGERVTINKQMFRIGKERRRVDYCISDNTNVSRLHADILYKNGAFYILDNNTTNGTTVNGSSLAGGQEHMLKNGDVIKLADEEFRFQM